MPIHSSGLQLAVVLGSIGASEGCRSLAIQDHGHGTSTSSASSADSFLIDALTVGALWWAGSKLLCHTRHFGRSAAIPCLIPLLSSYTQHPAADWQRAPTRNLRLDRHRHGHCQRWLHGSPRQISAVLQHAACVKQGLVPLQNAGIFWH